MYSASSIITPKNSLAVSRGWKFTRYLDCERSVFFFRFSKRSARARERWAAKPRDARNEGEKRSLSRLAPSVTRVVICVSRAFCSTDQEKRETARGLHVARFHYHTFSSFPLSMNCNSGLALVVNFRNCKKNLRQINGSRNLLGNPTIKSYSASVLFWM